MENRATRFAQHAERMLGIRVRDLRTSRGWTQAELAERMTGAGYPMHQSTVAKIEKNTRPTTVGEMAALAAIFGIPIPAIFDRETEVGKMVDRLAIELGAAHAINQRWFAAAQEEESAREAVQMALDGLEHLLQGAKSLDDETGRLQEMIEQVEVWCGVLTTTLRNADGKHPEAP